MPSPLLLIVHQQTSTPGRVGDKLRARGHALDIRCPNIGDPLPDDLGAYDGVVVFGGPMSANDDHLEGIARELGLIEKVLATETPYFGICLGAQLLARVLGGRVGPHPQGLAEIGYFDLWPTAQGRDVFSQAMGVYHWHREGIELPAAGTRRLAESERFDTQAFAYDGAVYGVQFHPEVTTAMMETWLVRGAHWLTLPGAQDAAAQRAGRTRYDRALDAWLDGFLDRWLNAPTDRAEPAPGAPGAGGRGRTSPPRGAETPKSGPSRR